MLLKIFHNKVKNNWKKHQIANTSLPSPKKESLPLQSIWVGTSSRQRIILKQFLHAGSHPVPNKVANVEVTGFIILSSEKHYLPNSRSVNPL